MPQGTSASWYSLRQGDNRAGNLTIATAAGHLELVRETDRLNRINDVIVIDAPPRIAESTRAALLLSHLCLVPIGGSAAEIWATADLLKTIDEAKIRKPDVDARIVWTRFRSVTKSAQELAEAESHELKLKELNSKLCYRVAYSDALAQGRTVLEWSDQVARDEMVALGQEEAKILKVKKQGAMK